MDVAKHIFTLPYRWHKDPCMFLEMPLDYCSAVGQSILLTEEPGSYSDLLE